jgi:rubrerythrin
LHETRKDNIYAMTKANFEGDFAGENQAYMKYRIFADQATKDGFPKSARCATQKRTIRCV